MAPAQALLAALARPFDGDAVTIPYAEPASARFRAGYRTFCGT
jgi:hypothetical protein